MKVDLSNRTALVTGASGTAARGPGLGGNGQLSQSLTEKYRNISARDPPDWRQSARLPGRYF